MPGYLDQYEGLLTTNPIWLKRTVGNGVISAEDAIDIGLTGPALRGSGVDWDLRRDNAYCGYDKYQFKVPTGENCDTFDRYKVRLIEMREACKIVRQALDRLKPGPVLADCPQVCYPAKENVYNSIEGLIHHFKIASEGFAAPEGEVYQGVEAPKGELGFYIVSDGGNKPERLRIRPPSFVNLQAIEQMSVGTMIADLVAVIGTLDIVLGEIDR
jgi:NADH-quinone oxidoreductase subunit D